MDEQTGIWRGRYSHIIRKIGVSESTIRRWIRSLEQCGYIERTMTDGIFVIKVKGMARDARPIKLKRGQVVRWEGDQSQSHAFI